MRPLRAVQLWVKRWFDLAPHPPSRSSTAAKVKLTIEQLEDRAAPGSLGGLTDTLGGNPWGSNAWSYGSLVADGPAPESAFHSGPHARPTTSSPTPGNSTAIESPATSGAQQPLATPAQASPIENGLSTAIPSSEVFRPLVSVTVVIATPQPGAQVPGGGTIATFGYVSPSTATMSAWITTSNNTVYNGTAITAIPPYQWGFRFTGIPTGNPVDLTVQGAVGAATGSQTIIITPT